MATALTPTNTGSAADFAEASTSWTPSFGFTATAGRLLVMTLSCRSTDPASAINTPAGWTSVINTLEGGGISPRLQMMWRIAAGGETSVALTKTTAVGFFGFLVDEYDVEAISNDVNAATAGTGATVTTRTATTATAARIALAFTAVAIREGTPSTGLALTGETWYKRADYRVPSGDTLLMCTGAAQAFTVETMSGIWTWTTANRAVVATFTLNFRSGRVNVWNGSAWVSRPDNVWSGSAWVLRAVRHWTGSVWRRSH